MSNSVRSTRCRPSGNSSHRWITLTMIVAMFGFAGLVFADSGTPVKAPARSQTAKHEVAVVDTDGNPTPAGPLANSAIAAPPANDTCAGAIALTLDRVFYGSTVGANDDYQTPNTPACFPGFGQSYDTHATGRDVVYSFTAPAAGKYTFRMTARYGSSAIYSQNAVLYLTDCANAGTVNCLKGGNMRYQQTGPGSNGQSSNLGESVDCYPMAGGQTTFLVFDDGPPGRCSDNNHTCNDTSYCNAGATCVPQINAGGDFSIDVIACNEEVEPNNTPATASVLSCGVTGSSNVSVNTHCLLGDRAGNVCTRPYGAVSFLDQVNPDSNMRCAVGAAQCVIDVPTGTDNCAPGTGPCQQQTDLDCDPRCDIGPNAGKACTTHAFCNPVSDQGATCRGACAFDSTCVITATGVDTGVVCTPTCQGSTIASVNGRTCASAANFNACPGGGTCTTTALAPLPGAQCLTGQVCSRQYNEGDADFYSVGSPVSGSKVFATVWAMNANDLDYRMRVTNAINTLQFDDNDAVSFFGASLSATIGGAVTDGTPTYIEVSRTFPRQIKTYQLYSIVRPPLAAAQLEDESGPNGNDQVYTWPANEVNDNPLNAGGYVRGSMNFAGDTDCYKFLVNKGDIIDMYGDGGPARGTGSVATVSNPFPLYYDAEPAGISDFVFGTEVKKNTAANVQGLGLRALSPAVTSDYVQWRASYTGLVQVCYYDLRNFYTTSGPQTYPTPYAASVSVNCGPLQNAGPGTTTADLSVTKVGPAGPVATGDFVTYTITITNSSAQIAQEVDFTDTLDPNLTFISLTVDDTLGGNNVACFSLPTAGTNDAPIDCLNASMAPGSSTIYTLTVQVNNCIGGGIAIDNTGSITSVSTDPNPANDSATASFTTVAAANNGCTDINCDGASCVPDLCTTGDHCDAGVCVTSPAVCDDASLCTDDSCDPATGCVFDPTPGQMCDDFNACTQNACDPVAFCVYPPEPPTTSCDDGLNCTGTDHCDGTGTCTGTSVCDDANQCTDDFADESNACACTHANSADGTPCNDSNACTGNDVCTAGSCTPGAAVNCDDGNACTADSCDVVLGCVNTPITCDDNNVCNGAETCNPASGCVAGTPLACDDGDACNGVETCNSVTGCAGGTPVVCGPPDQCHMAGVCNPGSGLCGYGQLPNGTVCDDGNAGTTGDSCQAGVCTGSSCGTQPKPKSSGYFKKLCKAGVPKPSHDDALTNADAACVGQLTDTFAGITTATDICVVFNHAGGHDSNGPDCKDCQKAEDELMALALNICRNNVCESQEVDSACGADHDSHHRVLTTVGASLDTADDILSNPARTKSTCKDASCLAKEINNGKGIHHVSLALSKATAGQIRLTWANPVMDDGSGQGQKYTIWRRPLNANDSYVKITETTNLTWVDATSGATSWEYEVTFTVQP